MDSTTYQDARHAQKASNAVIEASATGDDLYAAQRAMLRGNGTREGIASYYGTLEMRATEDTLTLARAAWNESMAASAQFRADQAAQALVNGDDAEDQDDDADDDQDDDES